MELRRLRLLAELQRRGTIAAVAQALAYSPSSVSVQLTELQREAGTELLRRVGRTLELTAAGVRLADYANEALAAEEAIRVDLAAIDVEPQGLIRVSFFQTAGIALVPTALSLLARTAPRLRVELMQRETSEALEELRNRQLDVVLGSSYEDTPPPAFPDLDQADLLLEDMLIAVPQQLAVDGLSNINLTALRRDVWAAGMPGTGHATNIEHLCRRHGGFNPDIRHRSDDALVLRALVSSGQAVTLLPAMVAQSTDTVAVRTIANVKVQRTVFTATRPIARDTATVRVVREALQSSAVQLAEGRNDIQVITSGQ